MFGVCISLLVFPVLCPAIFVHPKELHSSYDFIVVGAGASGCNVAAKLATHGATVLLIEAGPMPPQWADIPGFWYQGSGSYVDWNYTVTGNEEYAFKSGVVPGEQEFPAGKCLGGTSILNALQYTRGSRIDYDNWERIHGAKGWTFDDILPFFKYDESCVDSRLMGKWHGHKGLMTVTTSATFDTPLRPVFQQVMQQRGYQISDFNDGNETGVFDAELTIRDGKRMSSWSAFLQPVSHYPNLHITLNSLVEQVLLDETVDSFPRAVGVTFLHENRSFTVGATREVVLSAGAIRSPQILMLSGIGPREHLEQFNIKPIVDLPGVGKNYQDHVSVGGALLIYNISDENFCSTTRLDDVIDYWKQHPVKTGRLTVSGGTHPGIAFIRSDKAMSEDRGDIEITFVLASGMSVNFEYHRDAMREFIRGIEDEIYTPMVVTLGRPKSRGEILLRSDDPRDNPVIRGNYLKENDDVERLISGLRKAFEIMTSPAMYQFGVRVNYNRVPACKRLWRQETMIPPDEYLECAGRHFTKHFSHPVGTVKMGKVNDFMTVLDSRLRVKGVGRLRVMDASVMPQIIQGHPYAACIMIGAKGAHMLLQDNGYLPKFP